MLANLHTHTFRCGHATGEDREYVEAAIRAGVKVLGFSDHSPLPFPDGFVSPIRMKPEQADGYFASVAALRDEYRADIRIFAGFEAEHMPALVAARDALYAAWPVDYLVLGQHWVDDERDTRWLYCGSPSPDEARLARYVDRCLEALDTGKYLYLAHPDLLNFTGPEAVYEREYGRLCDSLAARGLPVEVNIWGLRCGKHYPSERFLRLAAAHGCSAAIAADAHTPKVFDELPVLETTVRAMCDRAGIPVVDPPLPSAVA